MVSVAMTWQVIAKALSRVKPSSAKRVGLTNELNGTQRGVTPSWGKLMVT